MQALESATFTNRVHRHFATFRKKSKSLRGYPTNEYTQDTKSLEAYFKNLAKVRPLKTKLK